MWVFYTLEHLQPFWYVILSELQGDCFRSRYISLRPKRSSVISTMPVRTISTRARVSPAA